MVNEKRNSASNLLLGEKIEIPNQGPVQDKDLKTEMSRDIENVNYTMIQQLKEEMSELKQTMSAIQLENVELKERIQSLEDHSSISNIQQLIENKFITEKKIEVTVLLNVKSGSGRQMGESLMRRFGAIVGNERVFNLAKIDPKEALLKFKQTPKGPEERVLVCGGDGTVAWILQAITELSEEHSDYEPVPVAILPLGTGNDLSRILHWGGSVGPFDSMHQLVSRVKRAEIKNLDRWKVTIKGLDQSKSSTKINTSYIMNNYFSIGCDAKIAMSFHKTRQENPALCSNTTANKLVYISHGITEALIHSPESLTKSVTIKSEGNLLDYQKRKFQSLIFVNIPSYSAGVQLWKPNEIQKKNFLFTQQAIDDGMLELCGITSVTHLTQVRSNLSSPDYLSQAKDYVIHFTPSKRRKTLAVQVDGEPFTIEQECTLTIERFNQGKVLYYPETSHFSKLLGNTF